jgi:hypothetical protein
LKISSNLCGLEAVPVGTGNSISAAEYTATGGRVRRAPVRKALQTAAGCGIARAEKQAASRGRTMNARKYFPIAGPTSHL